MAEIHVNPNGNNTLVSFAVSLKTKAQFDALQDKQLGQIVFLPTEQCIYFDGYYYGISDSDASTLSDVATRLSALETEVGHNTTEMTTLANNLAAALLAVKNQVGNTSVGENKTISQALSELQTAVSNLVTGVSSVNTKTGAVVLTGHDIEVSSTDSTKIDTALGNKVAISTSDTTAKTNSQVSGSTLTDTAAIATAIENAHTAAVNASAAATNAANASIAKSTSTTAGTISGATPASLQDGSHIITAIEALGTALVGNSSNWGATEQKTLSQLRDLINTQAGQISALEGIDTETATKITNIINELKQVSDSEIGDFANTILDKLAALLVSASTYSSDGSSQTGGGYYRIGTAGATGTTYENTLQDIIDALESKIQSAQASGVTQLTAGDGIGVTNNGVGIVEVSATSAAKTTAALTQTGGHGATTAANSTIQTALSDINGAAAAAHTAADTAQAAAEDAQADADAAQATADDAITQLTWTIIS